MVEETEQKELKMVHSEKRLSGIKQKDAAKD